jgi:proteasome lid subunit RPN8/RPN11
VADQRPTLPHRPRPAGNPAYVCFGHPTPGTVEMFVDRRALGKMREIASGAWPNEAIGLLAGRACRDSRGDFTVVETVEAAHPGEGEANAGSVCLSAAGSAATRQRLAYRYPVGDVVGWFHSHPHSSAVFSGEDLREQSTWIEPHNVGIVVGRHEGFVSSLGVYAGPEGLRLARRPNSASPAPVPARSTDRPTRVHPHPLTRLSDRPSREGFVLHRLLLAATLLIALAVAFLLLWGLRHDQEKHAPNPARLITEPSAAFITPGIDVSPRTSAARQVARRS